MALRKIGKYYYTYFRDESGKLHTFATGQTVEAEALKLDRANLARIRSIRQRKMMLRLCTPDEQHQIAAAERTHSVPDPDQPIHQRGTVRLDQMFDLACKYRALSRKHRNTLADFIRVTGLKYADQVTPRIARDYLEKRYGTGNGKTYNNSRTYLNTIFRLCLIESGLSASPFASLLPRRVSQTVGHRQITREEFLRLFHAAPPAYKTALLIGWHTGLRLMDCFRLRPTDIVDGWIIITPAKTARYKRAVEIPVHAELQKYLDNLGKSPDEPFCGKTPGQAIIHRTLSKLFRSCEVLDTPEGKASFHGLRVSFVSRCDAANIPRHATRGMAGQRQDSTTDRYSHDRQTPLRILELPPAGID